MLTGAPQVSSGEQLILEQILRKMQWLWLRRDAENVQDWTDKEDEVIEVGKKYEETTT